MREAYRSFFGRLRSSAVLLRKDGEELPPISPAPKDPKEVFALIKGLGAGFFEWRLRSSKGMFLAQGKFELTKAKSISRNKRPSR